jgi:hypothetical protein
LKKEDFGWNDATKDLFKETKYLMASTPVLVDQNFPKTFFLECDASRSRTKIGAMLNQENHLISFESQKLNSRKQTKSAYDNEMLEKIHALEKWKKYLLGVKFLVKIDHNSLKYS